MVPSNSADSSVKGPSWIPFPFSIHKLLDKFAEPVVGKISVQVPTSLCIHLLFSRNNSGNNGWPLGAAGFVLRS